MTTLGRVDFEPLGQPIAKLFLAAISIVEPEELHEVNVLIHTLVQEGGILGAVRRIESDRPR